MPRFLRMVRQGRWSRPEWLPGTLTEWQGDALGDLLTQGNALSVFLVDTAEMVDHAVAGLAAKRTTLSNFDYAVIEEATLAELMLEIQQDDGDTPHALANGLHYNMVNLTASQVHGLMTSIVPEGVRRVPWQNVRSLLRHAYDDGVLDLALINNELAARLGW